eukprot:m.166561 g.166561  ORF g.166561 m.166561 type:complete len:84 (-) comp14442_c1_seq1:63-314(-)
MTLIQKNKTSRYIQTSELHQADMYRFCTHSRNESKHSGVVVAHTILLTCINAIHFLLSPSPCFFKKGFSSFKQLAQQIHNPRN